MNTTDEQLRNSVSEWIERKARAKDEAALVWALQRVIYALTQCYPSDTAGQLIRKAVNDVLGPGR